jgi:hypothetical protein
MNPVLLDGAATPRPHVIGDVPDLTRAQALAALIEAHDADVQAREEAAQRRARCVRQLESWWRAAWRAVRP